MPRLLTETFFKRDVLEVAHDLIGKELHWKGCSGMIIETEAYASVNDPACHTTSRPSARAFIQNHPAGTAYIYFNYGMYWLFNLLVKGGANDGLILIRALDPVQGISLMQQRRPGRTTQQLCSGPGKLTLALGITGQDHGQSLVNQSRHPECFLTFPQSSLKDFQVVADSRVGISQAVEFPWRFLLAHHRGVSVPFGKVKFPSRKN